MARVVKLSDCAVGLLHSRGDVSDMANYENANHGDDRVATIIGELVVGKFAESIGVARDRNILDPGLGFSKRTEHSLAALPGDLLAECGYPVMAGTSRKCFVK